MENNSIDYKMCIRENDRMILRDLARKQMSYARSDRNKALETEWYRHRRFEEGRPMILIEMDTFEHEIIPNRLKCESEFARTIEAHIYRQFLNYELFQDDKVVPVYFPIHWQTWFHLFDTIIDVDHAASDGDSGLGHQFKHVMTNLREDMPNLKASTFGVDKEGTLAYKAAVEDIIGDILPVKLVGSGLYAVPTQELVHFMGMENMFLAMYDTPDLLKNLLDRIADDYIAYFRFLEQEDLLMTTTGNQHLGQGTLCYNQELPVEKEHFVSTDLWGFLDSQETVGISPAMYGEFIFPAYEKIAKEYGLLSYGCCEPVHEIWDDYLSSIKNLRNISISPWCDETYMGERLQGKKVIYHRKPSPNYLGVDIRLKEDEVRAHIKKTWEAARGCQLEFAQRDVYTIHNNPDKVKRFVEIIREVCR